MYLGYNLTKQRRQIHFAHESLKEMIKIGKPVTMAPRDIFTICVTGTRFQSLPQVSLSFLVRFLCFPKKSAVMFYLQFLSD